MSFEITISDVSYLSSSFQCELLEQFIELCQVSGLFIGIVMLSFLHCKRMFTYFQLA